MSSTFDTIANIIAETCDIPRDSIKPESHAINDLGIDSLDFLDIAFAIDKAFGNQTGVLGGQAAPMAAASETVTVSKAAVKKARHRKASHHQRSNAMFRVRD